MREIHRKDTLSSLRALLPVLYVIAREDLHFLEDMLRYWLDNVESSKSGLIIEAFAETVSEQDRGKIMRTWKTFREECIEQGMLQERMTVAKNMLANDINFDVISKATRLSLEEIEKLKIKVH